VATGPRRARFRSLAKWAGGILALLVVLVVIAAAAAPTVIKGPRFGRWVERALPALRGQIHVGGGEWSWTAVLALWRGGAADVVLDDVRVTDPEGSLVLRATRVTAKVVLRRVPLVVVVRDLHITDAEWVFATMAREKRVGFLAAFAPAARPGRARARPSASAEISIEGARLDHVSATFALSTWGLVLKDVRGVAGLSARSGGGERAKFGFHVDDADVAGGGRLRILRGSDAFELPFTRARLERVATTTDAPDDIQLRASGVATGRSTLELGATFFGVYGATPASRDPGLRGTARFTEAADAVKELARSRGIRWLPGLGDGASLRLGFDGPFTKLAMDGALTSRTLGDIAVRLALVRSRLDAAAEFHHFALGTLLPLPLVPFAAGTLDGRLHGRLDAADGSVALEEADLVLTRPENMGEPRRLHARVGSAASRRAAAPGFGLDLSGARYQGGRIELPRVMFPLYGGRISAGGTLTVRDAREGRWLSPPTIDLALRADRLSIDRLVGVRFVAGDLSVRARVTGPLDALSVRLDLPGRQALTVLGERFGLPSRAVLRLADDGVRFDRVSLTGPKSSSLEVAGRITLPDHLALSVVVRNFPVERLPGFAATGLPIAGQVSGDVDITGDAGAPALSGKLALGPVTFRGRSVGSGALTISPGPKGAIRARGRLVDGIEVDGVLTPTRSGLAGEATVDLAKLRLDPFIPKLPGDMAVTGLVSGHIVARVAPGRPASVDGRLAELRLVATPPARSRARQPIEIEAEGGINLSAQSGLGPIAIGPARFRGNVGTFELAAESHGMDARGKLRGRIELAALAGLMPSSLDRVAGALSVDIAARSDLSAGVSIAGEVVVAAPLSLRVRALRLEAHIPSGRIHLRDGSVETVALPVGVRAEHLAAGFVRRLQAEARVTARVANVFGTPSGSARIAVDRASADVPSLGPQPVRSEGGELVVDVRRDQLHVTGVDLPLAGEVRGIATGGANIDRATFGLRLRGDPRRQLALSGDVDLGAARASAKALGAAKRGGGAGSKPSSSISGRSEIDNMALDLRVRSKAGAVAVDVANLPDLRVDVDLRVTGTVKKPVVAGDARGANAWSSTALWLRKLFQ
jgi:hypothetical protein